MFAVRIRVAAGLAAAAFGAAAMLGCEHHMGVQPVHGHLFVHYKAPMVFRPEESGSVERPANLKVGTATATSLVVPRSQGIASAGWGDVSLLTAARNGGITRIHYADCEFLSILGVYNRATVYVYGE